MIFDYLINLLLMLILSVVALAFVITLGFQERWKAVVGSLLCAVILMTVLLISSHIATYEQDGEEFSKLVQEGALYLHNKNRWSRGAFNPVYDTRREGMNRLRHCAFLNL